MNKLIYTGFRLCILLLIIPIISYGQLFEAKVLGVEGLLNSQVVWADFDKNDSLEVLITGTNSIGIKHAFIVKNIWKTNPLFHPVNIESLTQGAIIASDINNNGYPDVLISGKDENGIPKTTLYFTEDDLTFDKVDISFLGLHKGNNLIADFNNDGQKDIFLNGLDQNGNAKAVFYKKSGSHFIELENNIAGLSEGTALVLDYNKDGLSDLMLTGIDALGKKRSILYRNEGDFIFSIAQEFEGYASGKGAVGDFDNDGNTDFIINGFNEENIKATSLYFQKSENFELSDLQLEGTTEGQIFIADLNHDGNTEILLSGNDASNNFITRIYYLSSGIIDFEEDIIGLNMQMIAIGDANRDGNPDLIQTGLTEANDPEVLYYHNLTEQPNLGPSSAYNPIVLPLRNKSIFLWEPANDDVTPSKSLTYDVFVLKEDESITKMPDANLLSGYRTTVAYGSQLQDTTWFITELSEGLYDWGILSVDNAFRGDGPESICTGGSFRMCFEIASSDTTICEKGSLSFIVEDGPKHIYSVNYGYLGLQNTLEYEVSKSDTLYLISIDPMVCTSSKEWVINFLPENEKLDLGEDQMVCKGEEISIELPEYFQIVKWLVNGDETGNDPKLNTQIFISTEIIVEAINSKGCIASDTLHIELNPEPQIQIGDDVTIPFGESTVLFASGGYSYNWSPAIGLDDSSSPNPTASPESSTTYYVTVKNVEGCEAIDSVTVNVQTDLFVPNLFTPNGDGNNEAFKIYGNNFNNLILQVFDRNGSLIYEGNSDEPFTKGWDGNKNGKPQPSGAYIWRIKGNYKDGSPITYQGKSSGTINLAR